MCAREREREGREREMKSVRVCVLKRDIVCVCEREKEKEPNNIIFHCLLLTSISETLIFGTAGRGSCGLLRLSKNPFSIILFFSNSVLVIAEQCFSTAEHKGFSIYLQLLRQLRLTL